MPINRNVDNRKEHASLVKKKLQARAVREPRCPRPHPSRVYLFRGSAAVEGVLLVAVLGYCRVSAKNISKTNKPSSSVCFAVALYIVQQARLAAMPYLQVNKRSVARDLSDLVQMSRRSRRVQHAPHRLQERLSGPSRTAAAPPALLSRREFPRSSRQPPVALDARRLASRSSLRSALGRHGERLGRAGSS